MRRNLFVRLLVLFLGVAVISIAATAWITTQSTSQRLRGEFERTLDADTFVYQQLLFYGQEHESWDGVGLLVDDLAAQTGNRVALTDADGSVLADSDGGSAALPATPSAEVDPMAPQATMSTGLVGVAGASLAYTVEAAAPMVAVSPAEAEARAGLARTATVCAQQLTDSSEVFIGPDGDVRYGTTAVPKPTPSDDTAGASAGGAPSSGVAGDVPPSDLVLSCVPDALVQPSAQTLELNRTVAELTGACLDEASIAYQLTVEPESGLVSVSPPLDPDATAAWATCSTQAQQTAMEPYLADTALLYIGSTDRFDAFSGDGWVRTVLTGLGILAAATGVTVLAGRRLTHPIRTLTEAAQRMASGGRGARVRVTGHDEVARLGDAFNAMASSIEQNERQRKAMVSDIAHELRTPLANVRGYLEAAEDGVVPLDPQLVSSLLEESALLQRLIDDLQDLALADAGMLRVHREETDVAELARQVVAAHQPSASASGSELVVAAPATVVADVDPVRLRQALGNLVANAVQYSGSGSTVLVRVSRSSADDEVVLAVRDDGPGIAPEHVAHLFDRFYRTDTSRTRATGGSGLGLAITKHLVEAHEGTVTVSSMAGAGSTFTIRLPVHAPVPAPG